ncbi:M56 family metallopeptidase [Algibacter sp. L4_22]|uniref:M56 family metallopeptidase n=1 Tax=Algibacter sp. L4_22 TaxID=2942477 RepID=UPI00201B479F|nr:M56 family metallopeptidase [Algibacter sp. L4_22]MCL5126843.1 M56 family metallopeptidase [Algibacter sp. L4_22]
MIHHIIQTIAFQVFFLLIYDVFLKKETFFNWNRFYLLATALISLVLPLVKIARFENVVPENYIIRLPAVILGQTEANIKAEEINETILPSSFTFLELTFYFGVGVVMLLFIYKFSKLVRLIHSNPKEYKDQFIIVKLLNSSASFSFFKYIFLGEILNKDEKEIILKHEEIHVKQWHSLDLMCFELLRVLFWFNPLIYIYQNRITELHEFIADAEAAKIEGKSTYYQNLLTQVFDTKKISFINPFFNQSLIKKRIVMLQKSKSKQVYLFKYALLIPLICGMLVYTSCEKGDGKTLNDEANIEILISDLQSKLETRDGFSDSEREAVKNLISAMMKKDKVWSEGIPNNGSDVMLDNVQVPFAVVEHVPVFPSCEGLESNVEKKACMSKGIQELVAKNFNTKLADSLGLKGRQRINVVFVINKKGEVEGVRSRAPHPALETEAIRVIKTLPKMIPGEQKGKKVNVPYSLPIVFQVKE